MVENLHRGAIENWLVRLLRHARATGVETDWTFYCTLGEAGHLDDEVRKLGAAIVFSPEPLANKLGFVRALRAELKRGRYEVLHCHHDLVSAIYLVASAGLPIRKRLVHVHNAAESIPVANARKAALLRPILRQICLRLANGIVGVSQHTLDTFLAGFSRRPGRDAVHYCGIDPSPFHLAKGDREGLRRELNIDENALILLFVGRMVPEKNPLFALEVFAEMRRRNSRVRALFVGCGSLEEDARRRADELGVAGEYRSLGWREDIPEIMACADWLISPGREKPMEGLGLVAVEAQLAGLRLLLSQGIPHDAILPEAVAAPLPLAAGPIRWAEKALSLGNQTPPTRQQAAAILGKSPFDIDFALRDLTAIYERR